MHGDVIPIILAMGAELRGFNIENILECSLLTLLLDPVHGLRFVTTLIWALRPSRPSDGLAHGLDLWSVVASLVDI